MSKRRAYIGMTNGGTNFPLHMRPDRPNARSAIPAGHCQCGDPRCHMDVPTRYRAILNGLRRDFPEEHDLYEVAAIHIRDLLAFERALREARA